MRVPHVREKKLSQSVALGQIEQVIRRGSLSDSPAYTLVLGAGASSGSVPTAKEMLGIPTTSGQVHPYAVPLYLHELETGHAPPESGRQEIVQSFWGRFTEANSDLLASTLTQTPQATVTLKDGVPSAESIPTAYQALFAQNRNHGINTAEGARNYLRKITLPRDGRIQLNGTHFFLASLLSLQTRHGENGARGESLYVGRRTFARTLFTTNFDPLLQVSLQLFQLLYYMTDRPELLSADALHTDNHPATHLFYAHGSVHRPFLANTDQEIMHLRDRNAQSLAGYLGQHGVIVLGYSGWDDCLLRALQQTSSFANNLYWLARGESSLSPQVRHLICSRPNAYWVEISDGGQWMASLHRTLCPGMPFTELLKNPIPFLRRRLEQVALGSIISDQPQPISSYLEATTAEGTRWGQTTPEAFRLQVVDLLEEAENHFDQHTASDSQEARLKTLEHQADLAYANGEWGAATAIYTDILGNHLMPARVKIFAQFRRGYSYGKLGDTANEIADYTCVIDKPEASVEQRASALVNRGYRHYVNEELLIAIRDFTDVINMPGVSLELLSKALVNRGMCYAAHGDSAGEVNDYTATIGLPAAPAEQKARAFYNRGLSRFQLGATEDAIIDYTAASEVVGASVTQVSKALLNRGIARSKLSQYEQAISDFTAVINLPDTPIQIIARALYNRGDCHEKSGDSENASRDYTAVLKLPGAPDEMMAKPLQRLARLGLSEKELTGHRPRSSGWTMAPQNISSEPLVSLKREPA